MVAVAIDSEDHWRELRLQHVGASDVAALFGTHQYGLTRWQLYHLKRGTLPDVLEQAVMTQGKFFEPAIAAYAQDRFSIQLRKVRRYISADDTKGMGATLDYEQYGEGSLIPCEIKWSLWGDGWDWESDELTAIPDAYMLQVQHQLACMPSAPHAMLVAFTGGDVKRMVIPRNDAIITAIKAAVTEFWSDVAAGKEPPVDFSVDSDAIGRLAYVSRLRSVTLAPEAAALFERYTVAKTAMDTAEGIVDATKAELLKMVIDAGEGNDEKTKAVCGPWSLGITKIADSPGKEVLPEMVGTFIGARRGHQRVLIKRVDSGAKSV